MLLANTTPTLLKHLLLLLFFSLVSGCSTNPVSGKSDFVLMSESQELSLGRQSHREVLEKYGAVEDKKLQRYVQRIGDELVNLSHRNDLIYRFTVLDSDDVNAFALPGGYIYVTRGLLAHLNTEDELAAVLGHEIGHVTARHSVRQYSARQAANIGYNLGSILIPELRSQSGGQLFNLLGNALLKGYGRKHELEADRLGAEYLARAGRAPQAMLKVIGTLKNQELFEKQRAKAENREAKTYHGVFATHPDNDKRLQELIKQAEKYQQATTTREKSADHYLAHIRGLVFGPSEKQGILRGSRFYHTELGFAMRFPATWRVENKPTKVVAISPGNDAMLQLSLQEMNKRQSPRQYVTEKLGKNRIKNGQSLTVNGLPAYTAHAMAKTPWGNRLCRFTVIFLNNNAFIFINASKDRKNEANTDKLSVNSISSFHPLTSGEARLAKPLLLDLMTADKKTRYPHLAKQSAITQYAEERLRLINGDYPDGALHPGRVIKIVR